MIFGLIFLLFLLMSFALYFFVRWQEEKKLGIISRNLYERDLQRRDKKLRDHIPFGESL